MARSTQCAADNCLRPRHGGWTSYCPRHQARHGRYGHPLAQAIPDRRFDEMRPRIADGLRRYSNTPAMRSALILARELLYYSPAHHVAVQRKIKERMTLLREHGVNELDLVRRGCEFLAYIKLHPCKSQQAEDYAAARAVLRLAPLGRYRPSALVLKWFGPMVRDSLYTFGLAFLHRLADDDAKRMELKVACHNFDSLHDTQETETTT